MLTAASYLYICWLLLVIWWYRIVCSCCSHPLARVELLLKLWSYCGLVEAWPEKRVRFSWLISLAANNRLLTWRLHLGVYYHLCTCLCSSFVLNAWLGVQVYTRSRRQYYHCPTYYNCTAYYNCNLKHSQAAPFHSPRWGYPNCTVPSVSMLKTNIINMWAPFPVTISPGACSWKLLSASYLNDVSVVRRPACSDDSLHCNLYPMHWIACVYMYPPILT
jgi:hypothetical protein